MHKKIHSTIVLCALAISCGFHSAMAESYSDRITVTVKGSGPDVLLIPGLTCSSAVWDDTVKRFEGTCRLHLVQIAGFAGVPPQANAKGPILEPAVNALHAYITANKLKKPRVIGHSLGGLIGMMLATQHPEDCGKLMIVDSLPFFSLLMGAKDATGAEAQAATLRDKVISETQDQYAESERKFLPHLVKSPDGLKLVTEWAIASDKSVVARATYEVMTTDMRAKLREIKVPVTMLYPWDASTGYQQAATDRLYQGNYAALPQKKLVRVSNSSHFIMLDQPEAFATEMTTFLK